MNLSFATSFSAASLGLRAYFSAMRSGGRAATPSLSPCDDDVIALDRPAAAAAATDAASWPPPPPPWWLLLLWWSPVPPPPPPPRPRPDTRPLPWPCTPCTATGLKVALRYVRQSVDSRPLYSSQILRGSGFSDRSPSFHSSTRRARPSSRERQ